MIAAQLVWEHAISHFLTYFSPDYIIAVCGQPWLRDLNKDMILREREESGVEGGCRGKCMIAYVSEWDQEIEIEAVT